MSPVEPVVAGARNLPAHVQALREAIEESKAKLSLHAQTGQEADASPPDSEAEEATADFTTLTEGIEQAEVSAAAL